MEEQLITFDTALFAKTKGFDIPTRVSYYEDTQELIPWSRDLVNKNELFNRVAAPTQSLLQKWLREKHNIIVIVDLDATTTPKYYYDIYKYEYIAEYTTYPGICTSLYTTYEEALEVALQEALKLI